LNRNVNDVSVHGMPASDTVAPGAAAASAGACPLSVGDSTSSAGAVAAGAEQSGSLWYVPGFGEPAVSVSYAPAGTKNEAIQTSSRTAARTVNAVGNLNVRACGSAGGDGTAGSGAAVSVSMARGSLRVRAATSSQSGEPTPRAHHPLRTMRTVCRTSILAAAKKEAAADPSSYKRQVNDQIFQSLGGEAGPEPIAFVCECSTERCFDAVWLTADEFESGRDGHEGWAILAPSH
jgi:hypothetical protein